MSGKVICKYYVYLLVSENDSRRTYIGYTNTHPKERLRKHNGIISGGAKKTMKGRPWKIVMYITGFDTERTALQYEFMIHHPPKGIRRKGGGILNKMKIMKKLLQRERICSTSPPTASLWLCKFFTTSDYLDLWVSI